MMLGWMVGVEVKRKRKKKRTWLCPFVRLYELYYTGLERTST
jgi:hypothetical protein